MKISTKIQLFTTAIILVLLVGANAGIYSLFQYRTNHAEVEQMQSKAESIVKAVNAGEGSDRRSAAQLLRAYLDDGNMIRVVDSRQRALLTVTEEPSLMEDIKPQFRDRQDHTFFSKGDREYLTVFYPIIWKDGRVASLEVTENLDLAQENLRLLRWVLLLATLAVLIPTMVAGRILSGLILRPILYLIATMEKNRSQGTFQRLNLNKRSNDELNQMAATYNRMMNWMEENYRKQQQFVADASHELKTPLTVIESYANLLKRWGREKPEVRDEAVEAIHSEAKRMKALTHQMLDLARDDIHELLQLESIELGDLSREAVRSLSRATGRIIRVHADGKVMAVGDVEKLKQLLFILVDNALKYSEEAVDIYVEDTERGPRIQVKDRGIGIPKQDRERIFERFYRVDKDRSRETGGSGLGLAIAKRIVSAHHGELTLTSTEGKGTVVTVQLPPSE
ncbi:sensor histidine kinase [Salinithrix halophila]|uniref:histidine kinase n=1 Tax=Salinithrix halophila TaxID=1485204 RepID=A0ABV8JHN1_9BACL